MKDVCYDMESFLFCYLRKTRHEKPVMKKRNFIAHIQTRFQAQTCP